MPDRANNFLRPDDWPVAEQVQRDEPTSWFIEHSIIVAVVGSAFVVAALAIGVAIR
jgi:hypothetical protein